MLLRVGVINVPRSVGPKAWEECFAKTAARSDMFGINECLTRKQRRLYARLAREHRLSPFALWRGPNPVFYGRRWTKIAGSQHRLHGRGPMFFRWPGFNAPRYATVALYRYNTAVPRVAHVHTHLVPRGPKVPEWWRAYARRKSIRKLARIINRHRAENRVVVVTGDFNMTHAPDLPAVTWVADSGVDKIGVACPRGWTITAESTARFRAPTDHGAGIAATVRLEFKENR